jgi:hypothetical protein
VVDGPAAVKLAVGPVGFARLGYPVNLRDDDARVPRAADGDGVVDGGLQRLLVKCSQTDRGVMVRPVAQAWMRNGCRRVVPSTYLRRDVLDDVRLGRHGGT